MSDWPRFLPTGDVGFLVQFGDRIDPEIHEIVRKTLKILRETPLEGIVEIVPSPRSILIVYDPLRITIDQLRKEVLNVGKGLEEIAVPPAETIEVPVVYGGEYGPDLDFVAKNNNLTPEEVVKIHTSGNYLVYANYLGFPLLGGLSKRLITPRLKTPRTSVPAGSVGIANDQTGVYAVEQPGGWQLIGRTPLKLYNPRQEDPFLIKVGSFLKFKKITEAEYREILDRN
jgi:inhibitor of KinA